MTHTHLGMLGIALALLLATAATAIAVDEDPGTVSGKIQAVSEEQITVKDGDSKATTVALAETCTVTLDGEVADVLDLKVGMDATLTIGPDRKCSKIAAESVKQE